MAPRSLRRHATSIPAGVTEEDLHLVNSWARIDPQAIDRTYLSASADEVAKMAFLLRTYAPRALHFFGVDTLTESEIANCPLSSHRSFSTDSNILAGTSQST